MAIGTKIINAFVAYEFIKILSRPFHKTKAFELGIIDKEGKVLKKRKSLKTQDEKKAYTVFHTLVWNIKKMLKKVGIGGTLSSFAAALYLIKEECNNQDIRYEPIELAFLNELNEVPNQRLLEESINDIDVDILPANKYNIGITLTLSDGTVIKKGDAVHTKESQEPKDNILGINLFEVTHEITGNTIVISPNDLVGVK